MRKQVAAYLGEALCWFAALATSTVGWIPQFTGLPVGWFLVGSVAVSLVLAWHFKARIHGQADSDPRNE